MSAPAGAHREPRPSTVSMWTLLAAGVAANAVSTPPAREYATVPAGPADTAREKAAPESEAA
ncbi:MULTISPECIES: hypothetical protein [unclassified Streptomyces]|uniref:hypothetical protein n=1 Tax=unclassified Streptomyces TaxID=2593676 RepID=UPI002E13E879|nr:hypothetical protein OG457_19175 [Streptomyces sp. NBC_01207]WTA19109.1 hypothetical protein OG365_14075 [Streptomyces sp. NBC_00853]